jgi:3-hydroxybutyryl-CoA dehydrogenase
MNPSVRTVYLTGDPRLVAEFAEICHGSAINVVCRLNSPAPLARYIRKSAAVPKAALLGIDLTNTSREMKRNNILHMNKGLRAKAIILSSSVTVSATEQASWLRRPERLLGIGALPDLISKPLVEIAPTVHTTRSTLETAREFLRSLGKTTAAVQDRIGMVMPRILCQLINEAFFAVGEQVGTPNDIDTAMKLGTGYPEGPIAWAHRIGLETVIAVLSAIQGDLGEERYRLAPVLRQLAHANVWRDT